MTKETSLRILKEALALEFKLYLKTWGCHWNVESCCFMELHSLFGDQYSALQGMVDDLAERLRQLGEKVQMPLVETTPVPGKASAMIDALMLSHQAISKKIIAEYVPATEKAGDYGTMDMLIKMAQWHDKQEWFLRSYEKV